ncbi:hypothetical protein EPR50_G00152410 [Perca flavescens]|uniref:Uncharacterized protein n=1 Tax=Perca flavescens TaxID=8167 RepID=A0A484CT05_PERFV|nr:hypothetical protein EPR50_G00152410 [Perca flavescens]
MVTDSSPDLFHAEHMAQRLNYCKDKVRRWVTKDHRLNVVAASSGSSALMQHDFHPLDTTVVLLCGDHLDYGDCSLGKSGI